MPIAKTLSMPFEGATWRDLRALVKAADAENIPDDEALDITWDDDGGQDIARPVGLEVVVSS